MMKALLTLRPAEVSDIDGMSLLLSQLFAIEDDFVPDEAKQRRGLELLLETSDARILVAEVRGRVVAMATLQTLISTAEGGRVGLIEDVVVDHGYRGRGVGSILLEHLQEWAQENGLTRLQLAADRGNNAALEFYRGKDWKQTNLILLRRGD
jgi:GNAT superfamily N-acetyltransferase